LSPLPLSPLLLVTRSSRQLTLPVNSLFP
jgi:hypothetical protein